MNKFGNSNNTKNNPSSVEDEEKFEQDVKKLDYLEDITRQLHANGNKFSKSIIEKSAMERKITQDMLKTKFSQGEPSFQAKIDAWDDALARMEKCTTEQKEEIRRTVLEPVKKLINIFPHAQVSLDNRRKCLAELRKNQEKVNKLEKQERTGPNIAKLSDAKRSLESAQREFRLVDESLKEDLPQMLSIHGDYFQPSLEALIKSQVKLTKEAVRAYGELSNVVNTQNEANHNYTSQIQQTFKDIRALSITAD